MCFSNLYFILVCSQNPTLVVLPESFSCPILPPSLLLATTTHHLLHHCPLTLHYSQWGKAWRRWCQQRVVISWGSHPHSCWELVAPQGKRG